MSARPEDAPRFSTASLPSIAILAILAASVYVARPTTPNAAPKDLLGLPQAAFSSRSDDDNRFFTKVPLWQDPFQQSHAARGLSASMLQQYLQLLRDQFLLSESNDFRLRVLFVAVDDSSSQDGVESRVRARQAVVGALRAEGMMLAHREQITYLPLPAISKFVEEPNRSGEAAPTPSASPTSPAAPQQPNPTQRFPAKAASISRVELTPVSFHSLLQDGSAGATEVVAPQTPSNSDVKTTSQSSKGATYTSPNFTLACELYSDDVVARRVDVFNSLDFVLVVWIPESLLNVKHDLATLVEFFRTRLAKECKTKPDDISLRLVGPTSSGTLREFFRKPTTDDERRDAKTLAALQIYSPTASSEAFLLRMSDEEQASEKGRRKGATAAEAAKAGGSSSLSMTLATAAKEFAASGPAPLIRTCATDDQIASSLIDELLTRGLRIVPTRTGELSDATKLDNIALVCEHESLYGRGFAQTLNAVLWHHAATDGKPYQERDEKWRQLHSTCPSNVHLYYYPRNVNDRKPIDSPSMEDTNNLPIGPKTSPREPEYPERAGQLDYIRRLAVQLSNDYRTAGRNRLRAIGLIGTDVNDKLALLQALRTEFPDILFFSTDLDARLIHHRNYPFTRSLVVASSYGLSLKDCYQRSSGFASFRDCFQTATYVSCRLALTDDQKRSHIGASQNPELQGTLHIDQVLDNLRIPRVFEIGREQAVNLNSPDRLETTIHPTPQREFHFGNWLLLLTTIVSSLALVTYVFPPLRDRFSIVTYSVIQHLKFRPDTIGLRHRTQLHHWETAIVKRRSRLLLGVVVVSAVLFVVLGICMALSHYLQGEPFSLFSGVSSWPAIGLGLLSLVLSMYFLVEAWFVLRYSDARFSAVYQLGDTNLDLRRSARLFPISLWEPQVSDSRINIQSTWRQYLAFSHLSNRALRVGGMGAVFLVFWGAIFGLFGAANEPYRGQLNAFVGRTVFDLSLVALTVLTLFVVDATSLSLAFVRHLSRHQSEYDASVLNEFWLLRFTDPAVPAVAPVPARLKRISEFVDMSLIAEQTSGVFQLLTYPFISLTLLILSRSNYFDNYVPSMLIIFVFGVLFAYVVWCAVMLQRAAARTKTNSLALLQRQLSIVRLAAPAGGLDAEIQVLESAINQIESMRQGAFVPIQENPLVRAILLPFGGTALVPMLDMLTKTLM